MNQDQQAFADSSQSLGHLLVQIDTFYQSLPAPIQRAYDALAPDGAPDATAEVENTPTRCDSMETDAYRAIRQLLAEFPSRWAAHTAIGEALRSFTADFERRLAAPHGCHYDLEPHQRPDGCVIDTGEHHNCILARPGMTREQCEHWRPILKEK